MSAVVRMEAQSGGVASARRDGAAKMTGAARYTADPEVPGMLAAGRWPACPALAGNLWRCTGYRKIADA